MDPIRVLACRALTAYQVGRRNQAARGVQLVSGPAHAMTLL